MNDNHFKEKWYNREWNVYIGGGEFATTSVKKSLKNLGIVLLIFGSIGLIIGVINNF